MSTLHKIVILICVCVVLVLGYQGIRHMDAVIDSTPEPKQQKETAELTKQEKADLENQLDKMGLSEEEEGTENVDATDTQQSNVQHNKNESESAIPENTEEPKVTKKPKNKNQDDLPETYKFDDVVPFYEEEKEYIEWLKEQYGDEWYKYAPNHRPTEEERRQAIEEEAQMDG